MEKELNNQCKRVLDFLKEHGEITQADAYRELGIMRLASRISEIKEHGIAIKKKMVKVTNRFGESCNVASYSLTQEDL